MNLVRLNYLFVNISTPATTIITANTAMSMQSGSISGFSPLPSGTSEGNLGTSPVFTEASISSDFLVR